MHEMPTLNQPLGFSRVLTQVSTPAFEALHRRPSARSQALRRLSIGADKPKVVREPSAPLVRAIRGTGELDLVYRLTHDSYVERGYVKPLCDGRLVHYPHLDRIPETTILVAEVNEAIVGTVSLTLDSDAGLHVDDDFKAECDRIRGEGRRLAASWRIATRKECRNQLKVVMELIRQIVHEFVIQEIETCVFTFNPRHERIYKRLLNMETVAVRESTKGLENAPAVFMRFDMARCPEKWLA